MDNEEVVKSYVAVPRFIASDYRNGKINRNELILCVWLRINADPYGITNASIAAIRQDIFPRTSENYVNKLLLSLRSQRYLYFASHKGRRGSFEVHFGDWKLPNGKMRDIGKLFGDPVRGEGKVNTQANAEVSRNNDPVGQSLKEAKRHLFKAFPAGQEIPVVRASHNDTDNHKDNKNTLDEKTFKRIEVENFEPTSNEEAICKEIALALGEKNMNFLLSRAKTYGLPLIERAWGICKEDLDRRKEIHDPPAYFNGILTKLINGP